MLNQVNRKCSLHNKRTQRNIFATFFASMILTATIVLYVLHLMSFIRWCTESHANMQIKGKTWACFLLTSTNAFIFVEGQMIFGGIFLEIDTFCVVVYFNNNNKFKFNLRQNYFVIMLKQWMILSRFFKSISSTDSTNNTDTDRDDPGLRNLYNLQIKS